MSIMPLSPEEVRALRKAMGWSQQKMADELGVAKRTVEGWENRTVVPEDPTKGAPPLYLRHAFAAIIYAPGAEGRSVEEMVLAAKQRDTETRVRIEILDVDAEHRLPGPPKPKIDTSTVPVHPSLRTTK